MRISDRNPFEDYRRTNVLSPRSRENVTFGSPTSSPFQMGGTGTNEDQPRNRLAGYDDEIMNLLAPSPGLLAYKDYLKTMPNRDDYKPSGWTRAAAGLSGFSAGMKDAGQGIKVAQDLNSSKYRNAMEDYATRGYGMKETAGIEQDDRANQVKTLQQARAMGLDYDKLRAEERRFNVTSGQKDQELETNRRRADAYIKNLNRGDFEKIETAEGVSYVNKHDPSDVIKFTHDQLGGRTLSAIDAGTRQYAAGSGRISANASASQAGTSAGRLYWEQTRPDEAPTPGEIGTAEDIAMDRLARDPTYSKFFKAGQDGAITLNEEMRNHPGYRDFLEALDLTARAVNDGTVYGTGRPSRSGAPSMFGGGSVFGPGAGSRYRIGGGQ